MPTWAYFLIWAGLIFFMMRFGCGAHVMGHGHRHGNQTDKEQRRTSGTDARWEAPDKDTDPVCGMSVETRNAKSAVHAGTVYYFCSQSCREKFESNPESYLRGTTQPDQSVHHHG